MLSRLVRSVRAWFAGDARLVRKLSDANNLVAYYQEELERERRAARLRTVFRENAEELRLAVAVGPQGCPSCKRLGHRAAFLEDLQRQLTQQLAECRQDRASQSELIAKLVPPAPPWTPLPPEVPAQPVAESGGEVRP